MLRPDILKPLKTSLVLGAILPFKPSLLIAIEVTENSVGDETKDQPSYSDAMRLLFARQRGQQGSI
ncbi:MAG: hypothetical protein WAW23_01415 [Candidatus Methanoperedens sp.]